MGFPGTAALATIPTWEPLFKGIDHAVLVESAPLVNVLRIDLHDPDISFQGTPSNGSSTYETDRQTATDFLDSYGAQIAINANFFHDYTATEAKIYGLVVTEGQVVSPGEGTGGTWTAWEEMHISSNNAATYNHSPEKTDLSYVWTAVAGETIIYYGNVWGYSDTSQHPRTALGVSQDNRYLYMLTADGRQYYDGVWYAGAYRWEIGEWLQDCGAYCAIMLDGGGSSTMAMNNGFGEATLLNVPSDAAGERAVANCLGVYALPYIAPPPTMATNSLLVQDWNWDNVSGGNLGSEGWEYVHNLYQGNNVGWDASAASWVGNTNYYAGGGTYPIVAYSGDQWMVPSGDTVHQELTNTFIEGRSYTLSVMATAGAYDQYLQIGFAGDSPQNGYRGTNDEYVVASSPLLVVPKNDFKWTGHVFFYTATAADAGKTIGINITGSAGTYVDDITVEETYVPDPVIVSLQPFGSNVVEMVFRCPYPSTSYPLMSTNLVDGSWMPVGHSASSAGPFGTITNLGCSAASGSNRVIYLEATGSSAFFGIGQ